VELYLLLSYLRHFPPCSSHSFSPAFCPYYLGQFTVLGLRLEKLIAATHMEGLSTSLVGYLIVATALVLLHYVFKYFGMPRAGYWFGLGYVYIKVALVSLLEVGIFPILCGFWIDACTLSLFNATLPNRARVFHYAPVAFTFIHWAIGMLYIFYMASLLILARSVVRPGVLRFVHHFNDPDYKPVQDMIMQPLHIYTQRLIATFSIWGILIVFMLWVPIELVRRSLPGFLPFQVVIAHESPLDYSVEIILIQVVLPFLLDVQAKAAVRKLLRAWCMGVGTVLGIRSYLVGDEPFLPGDLIVNEDGAEVPYIPPTSRDSEMPPTTSETQQSPHVPIEPTQTGLPNIPQLPEPEVHPVPGPARPEDRNAREDHDNDEDPDNFNRYIPYKRSTWFPLRMFAFGFVVLLSLMLLSTTLLIVPVGVGRLTFSIFNSRTSPKHDAVAMVTGVTILGLLLRLAVSLPSILASTWRTISVLLSQTGRLLSLSQTWRVLRIWTRSGTTCEISIPRPALPPPISHLRGTSLGVDTASLLRALERARNATQLIGVAVLFLVLLPVCLGLLINLMFIVPFQLGPKKTLIVGFWELWIFGIMHLKVIILLTLTGPSWWLRRRLEAVQDELVQRRYDARSWRILNEIAPLLVMVGMCLAVPYLLAYYSAGWFGLNFEFALRYVYIGLFGASLLFVLVGFQTKQLQNLYTRIKDEKYLIGRRLLNFRAAEPEASNSDHTPHETATSSIMLSASV
ncbi:E3 ubiquitin-protein ligase MARCH6, partial [Paragonimus skrjabini miyazakii]